MARIYYGWKIVGALFVVQTISSGFGFYNLSVYMNQLVATRGFAVSEISFAVSLFFLVGGVAGIWVARLLERYAVRTVMVVGAVVSGFALGFIGEVTEIWQLYLAYTVFGLGNGGVAIVVATTLVTRWFPGANRSIALSIASTGLSMGGVVLTPLSAYSLELYGLQQVMPWFGFAFVAIIVPISWLVIRAPDDEQKPGEDHSSLPVWDFRAAVRSRFFVFLTAGYVVCMGAQVGGIAHAYNYAEEIAGFKVAAVAVQALTIGSILFRFLGGWIATRVSIRIFTLTNLLVQSVGLTIIGTAQSAAAVLFGAAVFGASIGNLLMSHPLWLAEAFGVRDYPQIFSLSNAIMVVGVAAGPLALGLLRDGYGYDIAYLCAVGLSLLALLLLLVAGSRPETNGLASGLTEHVNR